MVPQDWAERVTGLTPKARLVVVPGMPHMIPFRDPRVLASIIRDFAAS